MKPTSSLVNSKRSDSNHPRFSVHFDDGMTVILHTSGKELVYETMLSVGPDTYFLKTGKWPSGAKLDKRVSIAIDYIKKNLKNNRYKVLRNEPKE